MVRIALFLSLLIFSSLHAGAFDHLKKMDTKAGDYRMPNIDCIYLINLDQRPEKLQHSMEELQPYGISPYRVSAVNGWELDLETVNELGVKYGPWMTGNQWGTTYLLEDGGQPHHELVHVVGRNYFCHCMSCGAIGIVLSHLSVLQDAYLSGYETIWVMEDDNEVIQDPRLLSPLIERLDGLVGKGNWDILFTDRDTKSQQGTYVPCSAFAWRPNFMPSNPYKFAEREEISSEFRRIGARYGAYSMIVRRSGIKKVLDFFKRYEIFLPFDMEYTLVPDIRLYTVCEDVVSTQPQALSDNGSANYKRSSQSH